MMFVDVFQPAFAAEIAARFVGGSDCEFAGAAMHWMNRTHRGFIIDGRVLPFLERDRVSPFPCFVGREMGAPMFAGRGGAMTSVAIRGEISGDEIFWRTGFVAEADFETVIGKGVGLAVFLVGLGTFDGEGNFVPLAEVPMDENVLGGGGRSCGRQEQEAEY
jgi:hypothetical protein